MTNNDPTRCENPNRVAPDRICIVGAGSSGIAAAKVLHDHGIDFDCFEKGSGIGGNWRYQNDNGLSAAYASLHINTSKEKMAFSDFPMPADYPDYPGHRQILEYFEAYVDHFGFREKIQFRQAVAKVEPAEAEPGAWQVTLESGETRRYRAVLIANGHHWCKRLPEFPGHFEGRTLHSHDYKSPQGFAGQKVLVVGIGNSAVDIACELSRVAEKTYLSTRRSAHILPKYAWGKPIDQLSSSLSSKLPLPLQALLFASMLSIVRGPQERFGVPKPRHHLLQAHPTVSSDLLNLVGHGRIKMKPDLERLEPGGATFVDGSHAELDTIVFCTGYAIRFPFLAPEILDPQGNRVELFRHVVHPDRPNLFFIGLIQPIGAVMPLAEAQAKWVARLLQGEAQLPDRATMAREIARDHEAMRRRYVTSDRHTIQVDFYPYLAQVQREARRTRG